MNTTTGTTKARPWSIRVAVAVAVEAQGTPRRPSVAATRCFAVASVPAAVSDSVAATCEQPFWSCSTNLPPAISDHPRVERALQQQRPSPGSVAILQQLEDEGLVEISSTVSGKTYVLTATGKALVEKDRATLGKPWETAAAGVGVSTSTCSDVATRSSTPSSPSGDGRF